MSELKKEDVALMPLAKVDEEMDSRRDEVKRITDGVEDWASIPEDREGRDRLPQMMKELNMLGVRRDEIAKAHRAHDQYKALERVFNEPEKYLENPGPRKQGDFARQAFRSEEGAFIKSIKDGKRGETLATFDRKAFGFKGTLGEDDALAGVDTEYPIRNVRLAGIVDELFQQPNIADLFPSVTVSTNSIEIVTEDYTDAAAETNEAVAYAEASAAYSLSTFPVRKIGVGIKATAEVLADEGLLRGLVQLRLRQDILRREDLQLLKGDGIAPNLEGIENVTGIQNQGYTAIDDDTFLTGLLDAATLVRQAFLTPNVIVMGAAAWTAIRLIRDESGGAGTGGFLFGPPSMSVEPRIWGLPVVLNENVDAHDTATNIGAYVMDTTNSAIIARNPGVEIGVTDSDGSDFLADVLTFKAGQREAFVVQRPAGFVTLTAA